MTSAAPLPNKKQPTVADLCRLVPAASVNELSEKQPGPRPIRLQVSGKQCRSCYYQGHRGSSTALLINVSPLPKALEGKISPTRVFVYVAGRPRVRARLI